MSFERIIEFTLPHEGGYSLDPDDPGGETNFGISKRAYPNEDIKNLTIERAKELYKRDYYDRVARGLYDGLDDCAFDTAVNLGVGRVLRWLPAFKTWHELLDKRRNYYKELAAGHPNLQKYLKGWLNRCDDLDKFLTG